MNIYLEKKRISVFFLSIALLILAPMSSLAAQDVWEGITPPGAESDVFQTIVSVDEYVFIGTDNGVYRSEDFGTTWTHLISGLTDLDVRDIALAWIFDPAAYEGDGGYVVDSNTTVALATPSGVFLGTVGGSEWTLSNAGLADTNIQDLEYDAYEADLGSVLTLYAATPSGVFRSIDDGANWTLQDSGMEGESVVSLASDWWWAYLYAVTDTGNVYATEMYSWDFVDEDWSEVYSGSDGVSISGNLPNLGGMWLATDSGARLDDGSGAVWAEASDGFASGSVLVVQQDYFDLKVAYAVHQTDGVYRTTNADDATPVWYPINVDLADTGMLDVHPTPGNSALVYAIGSSGAYRLELSSTSAPYPDLTPPAPILDLTATASSTSSTAIDLQWTAPGDDMNTGTAFYYEIRYALSAETLQNDWENASVPELTVPPEVAGTIQNLEITGLAEETQYYFGIKTMDQDGPGFGELSNIATATTQDIILYSDFNSDGTVNIFDYNILITNFGSTADCGNSADANSDCSVNIFDYNILLGEFGQSV